MRFPEVVAREYPEEYPIALQTITEISSLIEGRDFSRVEARSPSLKSFDWGAYLRLSIIRMVRALRHVRKAIPVGRSVLDFGSYFGNFALMFAYSGYQVTAFDSYAQYGTAFDEVCGLLDARGIQIASSTDPGQLPAELRGFAAVALMGVIEHIPHTPRPLMEAVHRVLAPSGLLVLDTPNLAYIYNRQKLARGESIFAPIEAQYWTELPFEGHHREYTAKELEWILHAAGFQVHLIEAFNYSLYGMNEISGQHLENFLQMERDPSMRELFLAVATAVESSAADDLAGTVEPRPG